MGRLAFLVLFTISVSVMLSWTGKRDPGLIAERMTVAENVERWNHVIVTLYTVYLIALLIVAGFDTEDGIGHLFRLQY